MPSATLLLGIAIPAMAAGVALGVAMQRGRGARQRAVAASREGTGDPRMPQTAATHASSAALTRIRSQALDVAAEAILIVAADGRLRDCNAAALVLLARHRAELTDVEATTVRTLVRGDGSRQDWGELASSRAPWSGDAHVRLSDGSLSVMSARLVPVFDDEGSVTAMVEVYASRRPEPLSQGGGFLQALEASDAASDGIPPSEAMRRDLNALAMGFAELETVLRQYERLLPAMRAEDPLTEAMAGLAAETAEVAASADVPRLLAEMPRVLARVRMRLERQGHEASLPRD